MEWRSLFTVYDFQETKDDELQGLLATSSHLDLTSPMPGCAVGQRRHLLMEADLKMKEGSSSKIDVHCFLFTDMLLICKNLSKKGERVKVIRQPYIVDRWVILTRYILQISSADFIPDIRDFYWKLAENIHFLNCPELGKLAEFCC